MPSLHPSPVDNISDLDRKLLQGFADGTFTGSPAAAAKYFPAQSDGDWDYTRKLLQGLADGAFSNTASSKYVPGPNDSLWTLNNKLLRGFADGSFTGNPQAPNKYFPQFGDNVFYLKRRLLQGFADGTFLGSTPAPLQYWPSQADDIWQITRKFVFGLVNNVFGVATPPCVPPLAPNNLEVTASPANPSSTSVTIDWTQPLGIPPIFPAQYIIKWGLASGNYNVGSATISSVSTSYTITGLNPSTTYFIIVEAVNVCSSGPSNEISTTTTAGVHLLNTLISYWQLENAAGADSQDGNTLSITGGTSFLPGGVLGNYLQVSGVGVGTYLLNTPANLQLGPGVSFTFQIWFKWLADTVPIAAQAFASATQAWRLYTAVKTIRWLCYDSAGVPSDWLTGLVVPAVGWHQIVCGYDASTKNQFASLDGGMRLTNALPSDIRASNGIFVIGADGTAIPDGSNVDECGFWKRVLNTDEVAQLYNGGAGWPYGSFTL